MTLLWPIWLLFIQELVQELSEKLKKSQELVEQLRPTPILAQEKVKNLGNHVSFLVSRSIKKQRLSFPNSYEVVDFLKVFEEIMILY